MAKKIFNKGNLVQEYIINGTTIKIYDGALVADNPDDPKVKAILKRVARIATENIMSVDVSQHS